MAVKWPELSDKDALALIERMSEWIQDVSYVLRKDDLKIHEYHMQELNGLHQHIGLYMPEET